MNLDAKTLAAFLDLAAKKLRGEWLLVGGTLLPAVGLYIRSTVDIDIVGLGEDELSQNLELMELAETLGLPIESINSAAALFVKRAKYKRSDLLPLRVGAKVTIFRPSVYLYWKLKVARLSESDLIDCQHYFHYCIAHGDPVSPRELKAMIQAELKSTPQNLDKRKRMQSLLEIL